MRMMDMRQALLFWLGIQSCHEWAAALSQKHLHEAYAKDQKQANLLPPSQSEADDKRDGEEKDHKVGDDVGI